MGALMPSQPAAKPKKRYVLVFEGEPMRKILETASAVIQVSGPEVTCIKYRYRDKEYCVADTVQLLTNGDVDARS